MTPFQVWKQNVKTRPETFYMGDCYWIDKETGWKLWHANGFFFYHLSSPEGGKVMLSLFEKIQVKPLLNWWTSGALQQMKEAG